jgi:chromatin segregation and condensation protein Rec8/ScpA/Scc1 (kleisin family)
MGLVEYRVELDVYNGPLDLLLYLLKRDELDIYDIPIQQITDSYVHYVQMLKEMGKEGGFDINVAGDFLVMAATLMEIKSAMLLPEGAADECRRTTSVGAGPDRPAVRARAAVARVQAVQGHRRRAGAAAAGAPEPLPARARRDSKARPRTSRRRWTWTRCRCGTCCRRSTG